MGPYLRRRWRVVGFFVVLMAGTALFSLMLDRGHDPRWEAELTGAETVAAAPDASRVYVLTRVNGTVREVVAFDNAGEVAWRRPVPGNSPDARLEATDGMVAVATTAPTATSGARLLVFRADDGASLLDEPLPFTARALALDSSLLAVAVQDGAARFPVFTWRNLARSTTYAWNESVESLDVENGVLAAGTAAGRLVVLGPDGELVNATRGFTVLQVRLDRDAQFLATAGKEFGAGGRVEFYRLRDEHADLPRWQNLSAAEIRYLDLSRDGARLLALASPPGSASEIVVFDTAKGSQPAFPTLRAGGVVHRQGTATASGARISPDGSTVAFGTLTGPIVAYDYGTNPPTRLWQHDAVGTTSLAFPVNASSILVGDASYSPPRGTDHVLRLDLHGEPFRKDVGAFVPAALFVEALVGVLVLGAGYLRRPAR